MFFPPVDFEHSIVSVVLHMVAIKVLSKCMITNILHYFLTALKLRRNESPKLKKIGITKGILFNLP